MQARVSKATAFAHLYFVCFSHTTSPNLHTQLLEQ